MAFIFSPSNFFSTCSVNEGVVGSGGLLGFIVVQVEMLTPSLQQTNRMDGGESWDTEKAGGQCRKTSAID